MYIFKKCVNLNKIKRVYLFYFTFILFLKCGFKLINFNSTNTFGINMFLY